MSGNRFLPTPRDAKRRLTSQVLRDILTHWSETEPGCKESRGKLTLDHLFKHEPDTYAKLVVALLPRDLVIESAVSDMSDDDGRFVARQTLDGQDALLVARRVLRKHSSSGRRLRPVVSSRSIV
jgi:hypothetical protein